MTKQEEHQLNGEQFWFSSVHALGNSLAWLSELALRLTFTIFCGAAQTPRVGCFFKKIAKLGLLNRNRFMFLHIFMERHFVSPDVSFCMSLSNPSLSSVLLSHLILDDLSYNLHQVCQHLMSSGPELRGYWDPEALSVIWASSGTRFYPNSGKIMGWIIIEVFKSLLELRTFFVKPQLLVGHGNSLICFARFLWEINENNYVKQLIQEVYSEKSVCQFLRLVGLQLTDSPRLKVNRIINLWHAHNEDYCFYFTVECVRLTSNLGEFIWGSWCWACISVSVRA